MSAKHLLRAALAGVVLFGVIWQASAIEDPDQIHAF